MALLKPLKPRRIIHGSNAEKKVRAHKLVREVSDERTLDDGVWAFLIDGHSWDGCGSIHYPTWTQVLRALSNVVPIPPV